VSKLAITKIHPIKSTLDLAILYITNADKTEEQVLVSSFKCNPVTAHTQFLKTREDCNTHGTVLARHLIQSFAPGEVTPEAAHQIGITLCEKILKGQYEYVLTTHVDRGHIHNHIIFNNVNHITGKCYQSNKRSYHQIRYQSDKLCKENNLSIIDEYYEAYRKKYKVKGKSWYENEQAKNGKSWKSRLQFDIDRLIQRAKDWDEFLKLMQENGYEIKYGKHIAFRYKDKPRFTRAKTIGEDYTEDRIKERIHDSSALSKSPVKKRVGNMIDMNSAKVKANKGYEHWATKHNLKTMAETVVSMRNEGIQSIAQLDQLIQKSADHRQSLMEQIKEIEVAMEQLSTAMEQANTVKKYREHYKYHKANPNDKEFEKEYSRELTLYKKAATEILKTYSRLPDTKEILKQLDGLQDKKSALMQEYQDTKTAMESLYQLRKNYEQYMAKERER
jgi:relaxase/mobilization nuclease domain protein